MTNLEQSGASAAAKAPEERAVRVRLRVPYWMKKAGRIALWAFLALYFAFVAIVLALRYAILPNIDGYRDDIVRVASQALGLKISVVDIDAAWSGLLPQLILNEVVVYDRDNRPALSLPRVTAVVSWASLATFQLRLHTLQIDKPDLTIQRDSKGQLYVAGIALKDEKGGDDRLLEWVLIQEEIVVRDARVRWNDELRKAPELALADIQFVLRKSGLRHDFAFTAAAPAMLPLSSDAAPPASLAPAPAPAPAPANASATAPLAPLDLRGRFYSPFFSRHRSDYRNWRGELYTQLGDVDLAAWHAYIDYPIDLGRGTGALRAWFSFSKLQTINGRETRLPDLTADVRLQNVSARLRPELPTLELNSVAGRVAIRQIANGEELTLRQLKLSDAGGLNLEPTDLSASRLIARRDTPEQGTLVCNQLRLDTLASIAGRLPFSPAVLKLLADYQPTGRLKELTLKWQGPFEALQRYDLSSGFENLSIAARPADTAAKAGAAGGMGSAGASASPDAVGRPGFAGLTGHVKATQAGGTLTLASRDATLSFPGIFAEPDIRLSKLDADAAWKLDDKNLQVQSAKFNFENADVAGSGTAAYRIGFDRSAASGGRLGEVNVAGRFSRAEAAKIARYLPLTIPEDTRNYLRDALVAGQAREVDFKVIGPLDQFPFRKIKSAPGTPTVRGQAKRLASTISDALTIRPTAGTTAGSTATSTPAGAGDKRAASGGLRLPSTPGEYAFHIAGKLRNVVLNSEPRGGSDPLASVPGAPPLWPFIEAINGDLLIDKQRIEITASSARIYDIKVEQVKAVLADFEDRSPAMQVSGAGSGPLSDFVRFTNASPIAGWIDHFTSATRASGTGKLELKLDLPLARIAETKVAGAIVFENNDVHLITALPVLEHINGRLEFTEQGIALRGLSGRFLAGPIKLEGSTNPSGVIEVRGDGALNVQAIRNAPLSLGDYVWLRRWIERFNGSARYTVAMNFPTRAIAAERAGAGPGTAAGASPPPGVSGAPKVIVETSLGGFGVNLPEPVKKSPGENWPTRVEWVARPAGAEEIRIRVGVISNASSNASLNQGLNAVFERRRGANGEMQFTRAAYGVNEPAILTDALAYANVNLRSLDIDAWDAVLREISPDSNDTDASTGNTRGGASGSAAANAPNEPVDVSRDKSPGAPPTFSAARTPATADSADSLSANNFMPNVFAIRAGTLHLSGKNFANVIAGGSKINFPGTRTATWQANIDAEQVSGYVTWRETRRQSWITARLARLNIPKSVAAETDLNSLLDSSPKQIPALDIIAENFELSGKKLGRLELQAVNLLPGATPAAGGAAASNVNTRREWQLKKLTISNPDAKFDATGVWGAELSLAATPNPLARQRTRLSFSITVANVGKLMDRLGLKDTIRDGTALLEGDAMWRGSPLSIDYGSLGGAMRLEADNGQFLKADPGIAKLLGVLSLQGLPRRISLDFRDVFSEGFAFDSIRSTFTVQNGVAFTKDFKMRGVQATVLIEGSANLDSETQNLHVLVLPEINVGAASLAAAIANPAIGLATFIAQYVLRDPLSRALSFEYNVTGSWVAPTISKISRRTAASSNPVANPVANPAANPAAKPGAGPTATQPASPAAPSTPLSVPRSGAASPNPANSANGTSGSP